MTIKNLKESAELFAYNVSKSKNEKSSSCVENMLKLAAQFGKFAVDASTIKNKIELHIYQQLLNASSWKAHEMMPFDSMAKQDDITLTIDLIKDDERTTVSAIWIQPADKSNTLMPKYEPLKEQVSKYLTKNSELFPQMIDGDKVQYNNLALRLVYGNT
jgi:hypothetical protein